MNSDELYLRYWPDPALKKVATPVAEINDAVRENVTTLFRLMNEHGGVGLGATQAGWDARVFVVNLTGRPEDDKVFINPTIVTQSKAKAKETEACLSLPGIIGKVERPKQVTVTALGLDGQEFTTQANGLLARCLQHELDHLEGKTIMDRFTLARNAAVNGKLKRLQELWDRYLDKLDGFTDEDEEELENDAA